MSGVSPLTTMAAHLDAVTERMIPPENDWPAAGELHVGDLIIPHLRELEWTQLQSALQQLGSYAEFTAAPGAAQDDLLRDLEARRPQTFDVLQRIAYLGYYAHPQVLDVLRARGYDINDTPQPTGYRMPALDPARVPQRGPGHWVATDDVGRPSRERN